MGAQVRRRQGAVCCGLLAPGYLPVCARGGIQAHIPGQTGASVRCGLIRVCLRACGRLVPVCLRVLERRAPPSIAMQSRDPTTQDHAKSTRQWCRLLAKDSALLGR